MASSSKGDKQTFHEVFNATTELVVSKNFVMNPVRQVFQRLKLVSKMESTSQ